MKTGTLLGLINSALLFAACSGNSDSTAVGIPKPPPMVFTMTNATTGNTVVAYLRSADGSLQKVASLPTGGTGVAHGLENQAALVLSHDGRFLYVVNPGSDDLSVFEVTAAGVRLTDRVPSGGTLPVSVAEWNGIVYVLNRHASREPGAGPTIEGFQVSSSGTLSPIPESVITLAPSDTTAAQIAISPDGLRVAVTERGSDQIDLIPLDQEFGPGAARDVPSAGHGPFGFAFGDTGRLYVSEAGGGTASSYDVDSQGTLRVLSAAVPTGQRATCWLALSPDQKLVYVSNTASGSISSYRVAADGELTLVIAVAATTAGSPLDLTIDASGNYLSVLTTEGSIETFRIDEISGSLSSIQTISGLPSGSNGLAGS